MNAPTDELTKEGTSEKTRSKELSDVWVGSSINWSQPEEKQNS